VSLSITGVLAEKVRPPRVIEMFKKNLQINLRVCPRGTEFLKKLKGVTDPEKETQHHWPHFLSKFIDKEAVKLKR